MAPDPVTWPRDEHTKAKHDVLRAFFDKWVSVHSGHFTSIGGGLVRVFDGFAGPGVYDDGAPGSPRILLEALLDNPNMLHRWHSVRYRFTYVEQDRRRARRLNEILAAVERDARADGRWTERITWSVTHGRYEDHTPMLEPPPSALFLFLDPFGYSNAPMSLTGDLAQQPKCDTLIFLPLSFVHRFADQPGLAAALDGFFGTPRWRHIKDGPDRPSALLSLFQAQLRARGLRYTGRFRLRPAEGNNEYWLVGASDDLKGYESLKEAFWKVDPVNGQGFDAPRLRKTEQQAFTFDESAPPEEPNTAQLLEALQFEFGDDAFTVEDTVRFTTERTRFLETHLRTRTLKPAEEGHPKMLDVQRPAGARQFAVGKGITMRFLQRVELFDPSEP